MTSADSTIATLHYYRFLTIFLECPRMCKVATVSALTDSQMLRLRFLCHWWEIFHFPGFRMHFDTCCCHLSVSPCETLRAALSLLNQFKLAEMRLLVSGLLLFMASDGTSWSWTPLKIKGPCVSGHAASDAPGDKVLVFGGLTGAAGSPTTEDLWSFENGEWTNLGKVGESAPLRRMYGASAVLDNNLYLFGGWDPAEPGSGGAFLDDVWRFDIDTGKWTEEESMSCGPVSRHTACRVGDMIVVHTFRGVLVYKDGKLTDQPTSGEAPEGLSMCAVAPLGGNSMVLYGGSTKTQELSSDTYVLNTESWVWRKLKPSEGPGARATPSMAAVDPRTCVMFGGACIGKGGYEGGSGLLPLNDTWTCKVQGDTVEWEKVLSGGPEARIAASLTPLGPDEFLLQGGYDPTTKVTYEEPWVLKRS